MLQGPLRASHRTQIQGFIDKMGKTKPEDLAASLPGTKQSYWRDEQFKIQAYAPSKLDQEFPQADQGGDQFVPQSGPRADANPEKGVISVGDENYSSTITFEGNSKNGRWIEDKAFKGEQGVREYVEATVFTEQSIELFQQSVDTNGGAAGGHYIHLDRADPSKSFMVPFDEEWLLGDKHSTTVATSKVGAFSNEAKFAKQAKENLENLAGKVAKWDQKGPDTDSRPGAISVSDKKVHATLSEHLDAISYGLEGEIGEGLGAIGKAFGHILGGQDRVSGAAEVGPDGSLKALDMSRTSPDGKANGQFFYQQREDGTKIYAAPDANGRQRIVKEEANGTLFLATTDQNVADFVGQDNWSITGF